MGTKLRKRLALSAAWLCAVTSVTSQSVSAQSSFSAEVRDARLHQAHELLGSRYNKSIVRSGELVIDLKSFIKETVQANLPEKYAKQASRVTNAVMNESERRNFDPIFLMAVMAHESVFDPEIIGSHGEIGLMQIKPDTAQWICHKYKIAWKGDESLKDPVTNIKIGAAYLHYLRGKFAQHGRLYLAAYNMGATNVHRALNKQIWPKDYPAKVMEHYIHFYSELSKSMKTRFRSSPIVIAGDPSDSQEKPTL